MRTDLSRYDNSWYKTGAGPLKRGCWYLVNIFFFQSYFLPFSSLKVALLRFFGARIAEGVVIKPNVNIKYAWNLQVGAHTWIGEKAWIDNLVPVSIGAHACLSQGSMLLTGNHNYKKVSFDLIVAPIVLEDGVWIGARSLVCPGVTCFSHAVLAAQSVATTNLDAYTIYSGNPATMVRRREISA